MVAWAQLLSGLRSSNVILDVGRNQIHLVQVDRSLHVRVACLPQECDSRYVLHLGVDVHFVDIQNAAPYGPAKEWEEFEMMLQTVLLGSIANV